jgi:hypothetical protein
MAITVIFECPNDTLAQLDKAFELSEALSHQPQRRFHICYQTQTGFTVIDVWESEAAFAAFGEVLGPVLQEVELSPGPQVYGTYETIDAAASTATEP